MTPITSSRQSPISDPTETVHRLTATSALKPIFFHTNEMMNITILFLMAGCHRFMCNQRNEFLRQ